MITKIPILMYHQVSDEPHPNYLDYTVTPEAFKAQMKILKILGFEPISLTKLYNCNEGKTAFPRRPVIITFDDGMQEAIDNAIPILEDSGFSAIFFIPTNYVGIKSSWMLSTVNVEFQVIDWSTIRNLDSKGFEIGAHSMSHPKLDRISTSECYRELEGSRMILEEFLEHEVRHMAYPFGHYDERVRELAHEVGYYTACTTEESIANSNDHWLALPRINVGLGSSLFEFTLKLYTSTSPGLIRNEISKVIPRPIKRFLKKYLYTQG